MFPTTSQLPQLYLHQLPSPRSRAVQWWIPEFIFIFSYTMDLFAVTASGWRNGEQSICFSRLNASMVYLSWLCPQRVVSLQFFSQLLCFSVFFLNQLLFTAATLKGSLLVRGNLSFENLMSRSDRNIPPLPNRNPRNDPFARTYFSSSEEQQGRTQQQHYTHSD